MMTYKIYSMIVSNRLHMNTAKLAKIRKTRVLLVVPLDIAFFQKHNHFFRIIGCCASSIISHIDDESDNARSCYSTIGSTDTIEDKTDHL